MIATLAAELIQTQDETLKWFYIVFSVIWTEKEEK